MERKSILFYFEFMFNELDEIIIMGYLHIICTPFLCRDSYDWLK